MKYGELINAYPCLLEICRMKLPFRSAKVVYDFTKKANLECGFYTSEEMKLVEQYARRMESGEADVDKNGRIWFDSEENRKKYETEMSNLRSQECDLKPVTICATDFGNQSISAEALMKLDGIVIITE